jgi:exodeoxyribonuclease VII large subunit
LDELVYRLAAAFNNLLREYNRRLDAAAGRVRHYDFRRSLIITRAALDSHNKALVRAMRSDINQHRTRLDQLSAQLGALSPVKILDRGYALLFDSSGALVKDASQLAVGEQVTARVARGTFTAGVKDINKD